MQIIFILQTRQGYDMRCFSETGNAYVRVSMGIKTW